MAIAVAAVTSGELLGPGARTVRWLGYDPAGRVLVGLVQVAFVLTAAGVVAAGLRYRRFRLLAGLAAGAAAAGAALTGILFLAGDQHPPAVAVTLDHGGWLATAAFPGPPYLAGAVAVTIAASPWLSRAWRRTAWIGLCAVGAARLAAGTVLPMELVLALATGVTAGAAVLVAFGVPDRRMGPDGIAAALRSAGLPVRSVQPAQVDTKGSRPFVADTDDGQHLFIKVLGSDQRDADLLYRAYRFVRLRNVGDTRPAASLIQAVEHQALVALMAERAGVHVPSVNQVIKTPDGTVLLAMERVDGCALDQVPARQISGELLRRLWAEVDRIHHAGIAHRSLRAANVMVDTEGRPWLTDFSFSELAATQRQKDLDVAELLASLATLVDADSAVASAAAVMDASELAAAVPLLQPLALSAATRHAVAQHEGLLARTRSAATTASGRPGQELARIQRVRPRTLLTIAALAGAFYFILPQLAQVGSSWHAIQSAQWAWVPVVIAMSALTYLASAVSLLGGVPGRVPFWPTVLTQAASSFINRVSPANVGGMALNARFLQKSGVEPAAGVAAVGLSALAGVVVHGILLVVFFVWASRSLAHAFKLPSSSKLLLILAVLAALGWHPAGDPPGPALRRHPGAEGPAVRVGQLAPGCSQPGEAGPAGRRLGDGDPGLHRWPGRLGAGIRRRSRLRGDRCRLHGRLGHRGRLPHAGRSGGYRSRTGRRPDRCRPEPRGGRVVRPHLPAGHLLAAGGSGMDLPELLAARELRMTRRTTWQEVAVNAGGPRGAADVSTPANGAWKAGHHEHSSVHRTRSTKRRGQHGHGTGSA